MSSMNFKRLPDGYQPKKWLYELPNGVKVEAGTATGLLWAAFNAMQAYDIKVDYTKLPAMIEDQIACRELSGFSVGELLKGTLQLLKGLFGLTGLVSQAEADRRAAICVDCRLNVPYTDCIPCTLKSKLNTFTRGNQTKHDQKLNSCAQCKCFLRVLVWYPINPSASKAGLPAHCWKLKS